MEWYPLRFIPVYKDYIWGGEKIVKTYERNQPPGIYAESWEVSPRLEGMSVVSHGRLAGQSLDELVNIYGTILLGDDGPADRFPLLIKLIDACKTLSVQVHPHDDNVILTGGEPKTEMWYVLDADPGAKVYAGLNPKVDESRFHQAIADNDFEGILREVPVAAGDAVYIPGGRVHAIGEGCLLLEVQQNSNTTYRIYDWGRLGHDGKPRPLHVDEAMKVIHWEDREDPKVMPRILRDEASCTVQEILVTPYFRLERRLVRETWRMAGNGRTFASIFLASGAASIVWAGGTMDASAGTTTFLPAALTEVEWTPVNGAAELLLVSLP